MNLLGWNCRGMGSPRAIRILRDLVKSHNPDFVFLSETLADTEVMTDIAEKLGFADSFVISKVGRGGGLAIMWRHTVNCQVIDSSDNHINVHVLENSNVSWKLTCYYGFPERSRRQEAWNMLRNLAENVNIPWCIYGDFNDLLCSKDKIGTHPHPQNLMDGFKAAIEDCNLTEIDLIGGDFTWEKSKGSPNWVREKLDRAFANDLWWRKFPLCSLTVKHAIKSDHDPIFLDTVSVAVSRKNFRFRFENTWLNEPDFKKDVAEFWHNIPAIHVLPKLLSVSSFLAKWGRNFFHKFRDKIKM